MTRDDIIRMAREAGMTGLESGGILENFERFAALVAAAEREAITDEYWASLLSDLEHGVKTLNIKAAEDFRSTYPALRNFAEWLRARGQA